MLYRWPSSSNVCLFQAQSESYKTYQNKPFKRNVNIVSTCQWRHVSDTRNPYLKHAFSVTRFIHIYNSQVRKCSWPQENKIRMSRTYPNYKCVITVKLLSKQLAINDVIAKGFLIKCGRRNKCKCNKRRGWECFNNTSVI